MESKAKFENLESNCSAGAWLADLSSWFNTKDNYEICKRIVEKSESIFHSDDVLECHFFYMQMIRFYYKNRDRDLNLEKAIDYCEKQICIAPNAAKAISKDPLFNPCALGEHTGFTQLAIIEKKNKNWLRVIELCETAKSQGWTGDWEKRIDEAKSKM